MLYQGVLITNASGKLNGVVASHNRGGPYFRSMYTGVQPDPSAEQVINRDAFAQAMALWRSGTTPATREAWKQYSLSYPRPNRIGVHRPAGAIGEFVRANTPRFQAVGALAVSLAAVTTPPAVGTAADPIPTTTLAVATLTITFPTTSAWRAESGAALLVYTSEAQWTTINFFSTPYTLRAALLGNTGTPLSSPQTVVLPFTPTADQRVFVRLRITRADGSLSMPWTSYVDGNP